jgi:hypothetical protein
MPLRLFDDDFRLEVSSRGLEAFVEAVVVADAASGCCEIVSECCGEPVDDILTPGGGAKVGGRRGGRGRCATLAANAGC